MIVSFQGEYDYFVLGNVKSHYGDIHPSNPTIEYTQEKGYGYRGSLSLKYTDGIYSFKISPFYRKWDIKKSDMVIAKIASNYYETNEPKNDTSIYGLILGFIF